ncbi:hypothetical protein B0J13DRAFT_563171 [Dactylonectria estremocensis]|uniref:Uncharacterized protein n=1 Tax=Dactylonectria estremocensis TaxID=1079267 RepID=A0A9P9E2F8_9HYPO|nr:hypothetical protein B0J13DRAFT_563171 [Dactylonectria estremocensis]
MSSSTAVSTTTLTSHGSIHQGQQEDYIIPSWDQIDRIFASSQQLWQCLTRQASSMCLQRDTVNLSRLMNGLPAMPDNLQGINNITGQATWEMKPNGCVSPSKARTEGERRWSLTRLQPTLCTISPHSYFSYSDSKSNGVAFLFFGWAYILCATLLEKQRIPMHYPHNLSEVPGNGHHLDKQWLTVDIGTVCEEEFRWWVSLLSPGQGWRSASRQPVWAIAYTGNIKFRVAAQITASKSPHSGPPSSSQAVGFLSRFARMYNLESQAQLALAMALTLPLHNETYSMVNLPKPSLVGQDAPLTSPSIIDQEYSNLSRYMTLSSNPVFLSSALWSIFWEPGVDCNVVSPWCDPIIEVVKPLIDKDNLEMLGHILALRRPNIAALWYGIAACGHTKTILAIIPFLQSLHTPVPSRPLPEVAAWTGSPQSFMDLYESGPYVQAGDLVSRKDVWRLRHECWDVEPEGTPFQNPPMCPWPPFGSMGVEELEIRVRTHINCERHHWVYARWIWLLDNGTEVVDESPGEQESLLRFAGESHLGLLKGCPPTPGYTPNHRASEKAVGDIFRWVATEMEVSGKDIYSHPWVDALADLEMCEDNEADSGSDVCHGSSGSILANVKEWVINVK